MFKVIGLLMAAVFIIGCGSADEPKGPIVIQTEGRIPTPTPVPPPTSTPDIQKLIDEAIAKTLASLVTPTPAPTECPYQKFTSPDSMTVACPHPDFQWPDMTVLESFLTPTPEPTPEPTPTPTPKPTRTPTPTPLPVVRPVSPPAAPGAVSYAMKALSASIKSQTLRVSGTIEGQGNTPTTIQVWHARDAEAYSATCSTERPIAFIKPGNGTTVYTGLTSEYSWVFCVDGHSNKPIVDDVPWLYSQAWSYKLRDRKYIWDPYIYDFSLTASIDHERVQRLEYSPGVFEGWRIIIFSGNTIIGNQWIDR